MQSITELKLEHLRVRREFEGFSEGDIEEARSKAGRIIGGLGLPESSTCLYRDKVKAAETVKKVLSALAAAQYRIVNKMIHKKEKKNRLARLLNYRSGDSWHGTHSRSIGVKAKDGKIEVTNRYDGDTLIEVFNAAQLKTAIGDDAVQYTRYFCDFKSEMQGLGL